jgi:hypothetical protein
MTVMKKVAIEIKLVMRREYDNKEQLKITPQFKAMLFLFVYKLFSNASMLLLMEVIMIFSSSCLVHKLTK